MHIGQLSGRPSLERFPVNQPCHDPTHPVIDTFRHARIALVGWLDDTAGFDNFGSGLDQFHGTRYQRSFQNISQWRAGT